MKDHRFDPITGKFSDTRLRLVSILKTLTLLTALFLLINYILAIVLAGGDIKLYCQLLQENHFQIVQWIVDSY